MTDQNAIKRIEERLDALEADMSHLDSRRRKPLPRPDEGDTEAVSAAIKRAQIIRNRNKLLDICEKHMTPRQRAQDLPEMTELEQLIWIDEYINRLLKIIDSQPKILSL